MKSKQLVYACLMMLIMTSQGSMMGDFLTGAKKFWPKDKGKKIEGEENIFAPFDMTTILDLSGDEKKLPAISFELPTENENFIKESLALIDLPRNALDLCTHRVISTLKSNCNQLTMEDVGKLAVMMLNCQLETEGRSGFPCTPEMVRIFYFSLIGLQLKTFSVSDASTMYDWNER